MPSSPRSVNEGAERDARGTKRQTRKTEDRPLPLDRSTVRREPPPGMRS